MIYALISKSQEEEKLLKIFCGGKTKMNKNKEYLFS